MEAPAVGFHRALVQSPLAVVVVAENRAPLVAAGHHLVKSASQFDSQGPCHCPRISLLLRQLNS